ncbi:MAG TPA: protein-disulfide reductase DsbD family protein [Vicinamibacterales bacterium]|nr:protein-disulfide reductase DsbD family protein [Vicinamibacterales bacterium]
MHILLPGLACVVLAAGATLTAQAPAGARNPFGEPDRTSTSHLTIEARVSRTSVAPGASVTVTLEVTPRRAIHVYAPGKHDYQVVRLSITPQRWLVVAPTKYPPSERYYFEPLDETVEVYSKPFRLTRQVTVLDTPEARTALAGRSSIELAGSLEYQACDDTVCYAPVKVPVQFTLTLER